MPSLNDYVFGKKDKVKKFGTKTPEQIQMFTDLYNSLTGGGGPFGDIFGQFNPQNAVDTFNQGVYNPAMRNFQQNMIPSIMQSFADQGASSGLGNSLATAGRDFSENMSAQLANFIQQQQMQNWQNRLTGLNMGMNQQMFQPYTQQGAAGAFPMFLNNFAQSVGKSLGNMAFGSGQQSQNPFNMGMGAV